MSTENSALQDTGKNALPDTGKNALPALPDTGRNALPPLGGPSLRHEYSAAPYKHAVTKSSD
jgi:hypothetical protein